MLRGKDGKDGKDADMDEVRRLIRDSIASIRSRTDADIERIARRSGPTLADVDQRIRLALADIERTGLSAADVEAIVDSRMSKANAERTDLAKAIQLIANSETVVSIDRGKGDLEELGVLRLGEPFNIPWQEGIPSRFGGTQPVRHIVVVADPKSDYFPRLKEDFERAAQHFHPMVLTTPDKYTGELPALAAYRDSVPVMKSFGRRVNETLNRIARGDTEYVFPDLKGE